MNTAQRHSKEYQNINNWKTTGNLAIDMIATAVSVERKNMRAPRIIYLSKKYWDIYLMYCYMLKKQGRMNEEQLAAVEMGESTFDDIKIQKSSLLRAPLQITYWTKDSGAN